MTCTQGNLKDSYSLRTLLKFVWNSTWNSVLGRLSHVGPILETTFPMLPGSIMPMSSSTSSNQEQLPRLCPSCSITSGSYSSLFMYSRVWPSFTPWCWSLVSHSCPDGLVLGCLGFDSCLYLYLPPVLPISVLVSLFVCWLQIDRIKLFINPASQLEVAWCVSCMKVNREL